MRPIRVLIVDDSALVRQLLAEILRQDAGIQVVGTAEDPYDARDKIKALNPDVLTLDIEMPRMNGIVFLRNLMRLRPMPVVMVSTLTAAGAEATLEALELGAVDCLPKPGPGLADGLADYADALVAKVRAAAQAQVRGLSRTAREMPRPNAPVAPRRPAMGTATGPRVEQVIALGASTGGTEAIREVLLGLPPDCPPVVIAQHIPAGFSTAFAARMDRQTGLRVKEAASGDRLLRGHAYVAPGDYHLRIAADGRGFLCLLDQGAPVNRHRPSVDVLFRTLAEAAGARCSAALLTGMGADGARGLLELRNQGAVTVAQDKTSSVVWGMPGEAVKLGAASVVAPLERVAAVLLQGPASHGARPSQLTSGEPS